MTRPYLKIVKARRDSKIFYSVIVPRVPRNTYTAHDCTLCIEQYGTFLAISYLFAPKNRKERKKCLRPLDWKTITNTYAYETIQRNIQVSICVFSGNLTPFGY